MSQPSDPTEAGRLQLQRALGQLPTHQPDEDLWPRIAHQLAADEAVVRAVPRLPTHQPDEDLWERIAGQLDQPAALATASSPAPTRTINRTLWPAYRVAAGMAAAVLLLLATWRQAPMPTSTLHETVSVEQDVLPIPAVPAEAASMADPLAQDGLRFIEAQCSAQPAVCQSTDFQSLRTQLAELEAEEQRLAQAIHRLGASPDMVQHQVQVTTLKATVTRDLIQLLIS
jgi:hypothetical protein